MATAKVQVDVTTTGTASLNATASGLEGVGKAAKHADDSLKVLTNSQQRAAQRMETMQEAAIKMNLGFSSTNDKAQLFADTMSKVSTTATASAAALGLPIGQLGALNAATDVASMGWRQLTTSQAGFTAGSVAVVGAGLAIGASIGTLLRDIPAVAKATDSWAESLFRLAGVGFGTTEVAGFEAKMGAIQQKVQQNTINLLRSQGKSTDEIIDHLTGKQQTATDKVVDGLRKQDEAQKRAADAARKAGEVYIAAAEKAREEWDKFYDAMKTRSTDVTRKMEDDIAKAAGGIMDARTKQFNEELATQAKIDALEEERAQKEQDRLDEETKAFQDAQKAKQEALIQNFHEVGGILTGVGDLFVTLGGNADSAFVRITDGLSQVAHAAGNVMSNLASGNILGAVGAGIGGIVGLFGSLFNHGKKAREEMKKMRDEFVSSRGGIDALGQAAEHSGISLDKLFSTKNAKDLQRAIDDINASLDLTANAEKALDDAMQRYGITVGEMGPKFAQQNLDKQAMQLVQDYQLLTAAGADHTAVLEKMAPAMNEYVNTAIQAGSTIPSNLQPMIDQMIQMGLLTDASGKAFTSAQEAGITFGKTLEESMASVAASIDKLVKEIERLYGLGGVDIPVNVNVNGGGGMPSGPDKGFAGGGIARGPASGHWELLHGTEMITPLDGVHGGPAGVGGYIDPGGNYVPPTHGGHGGGGASAASDTQAAVASLAAVVKQQASRRPVSVQVSTSVDASTVPAAHREQFIGDVASEVSRTWLPGGRNYRGFVAAVKRANAQS